MKFVASEILQKPKTVLQNTIMMTAIAVLSLSGMFGFITSVTALETPSDIDDNIEFSRPLLGEATSEVSSNVIIVNISVPNEDDPFGPENVEFHVVPDDMEGTSEFTYTGTGSAWNDDGTRRYVPNKNNGDLIRDTNMRPGDEFSITASVPSEPTVGEATVTDVILGEPSSPVLVELSPRTGDTLTFDESDKTTFSAEIIGFSSDDHDVRFSVSEDIPGGNGANWTFNGGSLEKDENTFSHSRSRDWLEGIVTNDFEGTYSFSAKVLDDSTNGTLDEESSTSLVIEEQAEGPVHNETQGEFYDTISEALEEAELNDTVVVSSDTYNETVTVDVNGLTLTSENATIEGTVNILSSNVTVEGFTIDNLGGERAVRINESADSTTVHDNVLTNSLRGVQGNWSSGGDNLAITENTFSVDYGVAGTENMNGLTIDNNIFNTNEEGIGLGAGVDVTSISGNQFNGAGDHVRIYNDALDPGYLSTVIGNNSFDTAVVVRNNPIAVPAIFSSIQDAINDASDGDKIEIGDGTYEEDLQVNKDNLTLTNGSSPIINGQINVTAPGVTISGLTITNPSGSYGVVLNEVTGAVIDNNTFTDIGSGLTEGSAQAVYLNGSEAEITNNEITNIGNTSLVRDGSSTSAKGIFVGDTSGSGTLSGVLIEDNEITNIAASTDEWNDGNGGRGAYGILINYGGSVDGARIARNTMSNLEGLWVHAIGLEGDTPNAEVVGNEISNITEYKAGYENNLDGSGIFFEDNSSFDTVKINKNNFLSDGSWYGVAMHSSMSGSDIADAEENYWGTVLASEVELRTSTTDSIVIDYDPWLCQPFQDGSKVSVNRSCDTDMPEVNITSHEDGDFVKGSTIFEAEISDESGVQDYRFALRYINEDGSIDSVAGFGGTQDVSGEPENYTATVDWDSTSDFINAFDGPKDGTYEIRAFATDVHGNEARLSTAGGDTQRFTVDNTKPAAVTISPETNEAVSGEVTFEADLTDNIQLADYRVIVHYKEGGVNDRVYYGDWTPIDNPGTENTITHDWGSTQHEDGEYHVRIFARDKAGNIAAHHETEDRYFVVDNTDPEVKIDGQEPKNLYGVSDNNLNVHIVDDNVGDTYIYGYTDGDRDDSPYKTYEGGAYFHIRWLPEGTYDIHHVDQAGNESEAHTFVYDKTGPNVSDVDLNGESVSSNHIRSENCEDIEHTHLVSGEVDFSAVIEDDMSDVGSAYYRVRKLNSNGCTTSNEIDRTNLQDEDATQDSWQVSGTFDTEQIEEDGIYTIVLVAEDSAGNQTTTFIDLQVDNTAPKITNVSLAPNVINPDEDSPALTADVEDVGSGIKKVQYKVYASDGTTVAGYKDIDYDSATSSVDDEIDIAGLEDGEYNLGVRAFDNVGNKKNVGNAASSIQIPFTVDTISPRVTNASLSENLINSDEGSPTLVADIDATGSNVAVVQYRIHKSPFEKIDDFGWEPIDAEDGDYDSIFESISGQINVAGLEDGDYLVRIRAFDVAGNKKSGVDLEFTVDNTGPEVGITSAEQTANTLSFSGYVNDANFNYYYCWLTPVSGGEVAERGDNCVTTWADGLQRNGNPATETNEGQGDTDNPVFMGDFDISGLDSGEYIVRLSGVDTVGNQSFTEYEVTIDSSIYGLVQTTDDLSVLRAAIDEAGLDGVLADEEDEFTVFAPENEAFVELLGALDLTAEELLALEGLGDILLYHVVDQKVLSSELSDGQEIETLTGEVLTVSIVEGDVFITDADGNDSQVIQPDVEANNGVVHIIDGVLLDTEEEATEPEDETQADDLPPINGGDGQVEGANTGQQAGVGGGDGVFFAQANTTGDGDTGANQEDDEDTNNGEESEDDARTLGASDDTDEQNGEVRGAVDEAANDSSFGMTFAWILIVLAALAAFYFLFARRKAEQE